MSAARFALLSTAARIMPRTSRRQAREDARLMAWVQVVLDGMRIHERKKRKGSWTDG